MIVITESDPETSRELEAVYCHTAAVKEQIGEVLRRMQQEADDENGEPTFIHDDEDACATVGDLRAWRYRLGGATRFAFQEAVLARSAALHALDLSPAQVHWQLENTVWYRCRGLMALGLVLGMTAKAEPGGTVPPERSGRAIA